MASERVTYNDRLVWRFVLAAILWGIAAMVVGVLLAVQLAFWQANVSPEISFARLRPLHTNALLFAFVGNMVFAGILYSSQRLLRARLPYRALGELHFWGWQAVIAAGLATIPFGFTQGKEYAELEWPFDLAIAALWLAFAVNFFTLIARRRVARLFVSIWFYIATVIAFGVLYVFGNLAVPIGLLDSISLFGGSRDAIVQWWYGHNAISFFMTMPVLGILYYFLPRAAGRPLYSHRLAVVHFWALVFLYVWAGPHHLLNTSVPEWVQSVGVVFSILLWVPSWGGAANAFLTLRDSWDDLRADPVLKFLAVGVVMFVIVTLEGAFLSLRSVSGHLHFTDWIVGHAHASGLGWNGFMAAGVFYWLAPALTRTELRSRKLANLHFWLACAGLFIYVTSMWIAGATQGAMWRAESAEGGLAYPNFVETMAGQGVFYIARIAGGLLYLGGFILLAWNVIATVRRGRLSDEEEEGVEPEAIARVPLRSTLFAPPVISGLVVFAVVLIGARANPGAALAFFMLATIASVFVIATADRGWHGRLEGRALAVGLLVAAALVISTVIELAPILGQREPAGEQAPYTELELAGREVYIAEGCHNCHSQMVRPFLWETARYPSSPSSRGESAYDYPFQWGSRRIGPDLARVGGKYPHSWHLDHMRDPRLVSPGSSMPAYPHLASARLDDRALAAKVAALRGRGAPIEKEPRAEQSERVRAELALELEGLGGVVPPADSELVALIAYLQRLGVPPTLEEAP